MSTLCAFLIKKNQNFWKRLHVRLPIFITWFDLSFGDKILFLYYLQGHSLDNYEKHEERERLKNNCVVHLIINQTLNIIETYMQPSDKLRTLIEMQWYVKVFNTRRNNMLDQDWFSPYPYFGLEYISVLQRSTDSHCSWFTLDCKTQLQCYFHMVAISMIWDSIFRSDEVIW